MILHICGARILKNLYQLALMVYYHIDCCYVKTSSVLAKEQKLKTSLPESANSKMFGLTHTLNTKTILQPHVTIISQDLSKPS